MLPVCPFALPQQQNRHRVPVYNSSFTDIGAAMSISAWFSDISGRESISGVLVEFRFSYTCDLSTIEMIISARLTSLELVTTGVGISYRGAGTKLDSLTGYLRPTLRSEFFIIYFRTANQDGAVNWTRIGK